MHIQEEMKLHLNYCREFGIAQEEVERHEESQGRFFFPSEYPLRKDG
jgi:ATP-dependent RNA helicase DDX5/DBP2